MPLAGEPSSAAEVATWIREQAQARDRFIHISRSSEAHRVEHGPFCTVYPTGSGPLLGVLAAGTGARRILEVGCGLGYSAAWLAFGSAPDGTVETIEKDPVHVELAALQLAREGYGGRVTIHQGSGADILPRLGGPYDLIFCDGELDEYLVDLDQFLRLLRPAGLLITSNLFLGQYAPEIPGLVHAATYRRRLLEDARLLTTFLPGGLALSVRTT